jgi:hypothetical protein
MSKDWIPEWGGSLGLWSHDEEGNSCGELVKTVDCIFNRAVIFNTTQNSWHGLPEPITCPEDRTRNSLAAYYVGEANSDASDRGKALFVPYKDQSKDQSIIDLIEKRSNVNSASSVYLMSQVYHLHQPRRTMLHLGSDEDHQCYDLQYPLDALALQLMK